MQAHHLNGVLIVAILLISTAPLYAQRQQQNVAKLKTDARDLVGIIGSDKTKTQTYCQIDNLSEQLLQAVQEKDRKKASALAEKIAELTPKPCESWDGWKGKMSCSSAATQRIGSNDCLRWRRT